MRKVSTAELLEMVQGGATVKKQDRPIEVAGLVEELRKASEAQRETAEMQAGALKAAIEKIAVLMQGKAVDMDRFEEIMRGVAEAMRPQQRPDYEFRVSRDVNGRIASFTAEAKRKLN